MMDALMDQVNKTVDYAVEERTRLYGPHYESALEGYGDVTRQMIGVMASQKELKKDVTDLVGYVNSLDAQELIKALDMLDSKARLLAYEALRMCEIIVRYKTTIKNRSGGNLLDILDDLDEEDNEND